MGPGLRAGAGRAIITPATGMPMGGWSNALHDRSDGNDLDLVGTVLAVTDGNTGAIQAELDLCLLKRDERSARSIENAVVGNGHDGGERNEQQR